MSEVSDLKIQNLQNQENPLLKWFLEVEASLMKKPREVTDMLL